MVRIVHRLVEFGAYNLLYRTPGLLNIFIKYGLIITLIKVLHTEIVCMIQFHVIAVC